MSETTQKQSSEREANGQFAKGNKGGPGNPHARKMAQVRQWVYEEVPEADMRQIIRKIAEMAAEGDLNAAKLILLYQAGKPAPFQDPDAVDHHELDLTARTASSVAPAVQGLHTLNPGAALDFIRTAVPALHKVHSARIEQELAEVDDEDDIVADEDRTEEEIERDRIVAAMLEDFLRHRADRQRHKRPQGQHATRQRPGDDRPPSSQ